MNKEITVIKSEKTIKLNKASLINLISDKNNWFKKRNSKIIPNEILLLQ